MIQMNELFALHIDGQLLTAKNRQKLWEKYSKNYGHGTYGLYGWKPPKPFYSKLGYARRGIAHLPGEIQDEIEIVRYVPEESTDE